MPCYHPLQAYRSQSIDGARTISFNAKYHDQWEHLKLPCGQCVGCRLERSRQWAVRCMHEAQMYENNCFITLTFNEDALQKRKNPYSVDVRDFQLFMKRLRKRFHPQKIRFYHCGEYGDQNARPHYHACLFNFDFPDKSLWKISNGNRLYTSQTLEEVWSDPVSKEPLGFCTIGDVTFESAAYCARYIMKKVNGKNKDIHYCDIHSQTGEILSERKPEYTTMSRNPGIGNGWLQKYETDVYPHDEVVINGVKCKPPKYYDNILKTTRPYEFDEIKQKRVDNAEKHADNNTEERLYIREKVQNARLKLLPRNI